MRKFFADVGKGADFQQVFWAWSAPQQTLEEGFVYFKNAKELLMKMRQMPDTARFIFHGMFDRSVWPRLFFSILPERCSWVCWGADLYEHMAADKTIPRRIAHIFHKALITRFLNVFALNDGDGELMYKFICKRQVITLPYPLIGSNAKPNKRKEKLILVGNSANPSNEHFEALKSLSQFADEGIRVVVPLNYGGAPDYVQKVCDLGRLLFGEKFHGITNMMTKEDYDQLLADTDVTVFAHNRQQGLYVVYSMLKYGKKLYMRSDVSSFDSLRASGFRVFDIADIMDGCFADFISQSEQSVNTNSELMNNMYSEQALLPRWREQLVYLSNQN